jgi:CBS-domain-containing membrane protein
MATVADVMTRDVLAISSDSTLREALTYLASQRISGAPVTDHRHRLLGAISRSDIIEAESEISEPRARERYLEDTVVSDLMSTPALTIGPDADLREAALAMDYGDVHRLFVQSDGKLLGVLSRTDVSRAVAQGSI